MLMGDVINWYLSVWYIVIYIHYGIVVIKTKLIDVIFMSDIA